MVSSVMESLQKYTSASTVWSDAEKQEVRKLCEVGKSFLRQKLVALVKQAKGAPTLLSYSCDGTPLTTKQRFRSQLGEKAGRRVGGASQEFLVQQALVRFVDGKGVAHTGVAFRDTLPLTEGKSAWAIFAAAVDFLPTLREMGCASIAIQHVSFDRALHAPLSRRFQQHHALVNQRQGSPPDGATGEVGWRGRELQSMLQWDASTPCSAHDAHNALKWALLQDFSDPDLLKDTHISIESLRNSYGMLSQYMAAWLGKTILFVDEPLAGEVLYDLYTLLGVEADSADALVEMVLEGRLQVSRAWGDRADLCEKLSGALLHLWRFSRFTASRWVTVGAACRALTLGLLTGLGSLVHAIVSDPSASKFHIGGFARIHGRVTAFVVKVGVVAYIPETFLAELLEDDRLVARLDPLGRALDEELSWVMRIKPAVWGLLGGGVEVRARDSSLRLHRRWPHRALLHLQQGAVPREEVSLVLGPGRCHREPGPPGSEG
jgi:hypothetical protein